MAVIECQQLEKHFGELKALGGVSFEVPESGIFGLIGPNGAGKTTLFSLILGYLQPTAGRVRILGGSPHDLYQQRGKIGVLPQDADLPPTVTVEQALSFFGRLAGVSTADLKAEVARVSDLVDLGQWRHAKLRQLSHGMKKRVFIAQALIGRPSLVILDEPTAGLDPKHAYELGLVFKKLSREITFVISSHNLTELENLCDRAAILVKGQVVRYGTMDEIRRADEEVHIKLANGPPNTEKLAAALADVSTSWQADNHQLTLRFSATAERPAEAVTTLALSTLIADGALIVGVERGQSLLKTYLEVS